MSSQCTKLQGLRSRTVVFTRAHKRHKRCTHSCWALLTVHRRADKDQHKKKEKMRALKTIKKTWCASGEQELVRDCALREAWVHNLQHGESTGRHSCV